MITRKIKMGEFFNYFPVRFRTLRAIHNHFLMGSFLRGGSKCPQVGKSQWLISPNFTRRHISTKVIPHQKELLKTKHTIGWRCCNVFCRIKPIRRTRQPCRGKAANRRSQEDPLQRVMNQFYSRITKCIESRGGVFEQFMHT